MALQWCFLLLWDDIPPEKTSVSLLAEQMGGNGVSYKQFGPGGKLAFAYFNVVGCDVNNIKDVMDAIHVHSLYNSNILYGEKLFKSCESYHI